MACDENKVRELANRIEEAVKAAQSLDEARREVIRLVEELRSLI